MIAESCAPKSADENREEWFWMLIAYLKMKTLANWLHHYPDTSYESFEAIWPALFDQMLAQATATAVEQLQIIVQLNLN